MHGSKIQKLLRHYRIYQWELAQKLGISEFTLSRWLRGILNVKQVDKILQAINEPREEKDKDYATNKNN